MAGDAIYGVKRSILRMGRWSMNPTGIFFHQCVGKVELVRLRDLQVAALPPWSMAGLIEISWRSRNSNHVVDTRGFAGLQSCVLNECGPQTWPQFPSSSGFMAEQVIMKDIRGVGETQARQARTKS